MGRLSGGRDDLQEELEEIHGKLASLEVLLERRLTDDPKRINSTPTERTTGLDSEYWIG
jgi:hypothetical protein